MNKYTENYYSNIERLNKALKEADSIVIGGGAGLSVSAGFSYSGTRFERYFADFQKIYGIQDMYSGGFYPFSSLEEYWAWWSRHIYYNRYVPAPIPVYNKLFDKVKDRDYFVLTTNVDHQFQKANFDKKRLFYTQGDYGLWQCSKACHEKTYDNEKYVKEMVDTQQDMKIDSKLIPYCPVCGAPMTMNLRCDDTFVQDEGWYEAKRRYQDFISSHSNQKIIYLELGVGSNTPVIIKYPFWNYVINNNNATYVCINNSQAYAPKEIYDKSILIKCDISKVLDDLM